MEKSFEKIGIIYNSDISEAKNLAKQIFHINNELSYINFDNAKCVIVYSATLFRITFESDSEFACYSIVKQN